MKALNVYGLSGLFYELYNPQIPDFNTTPLCASDNNPLRRMNALFWAQLFSAGSLKNLVKTIENACRIKTKKSIQEMAVLVNPDLFIRLAIEAPLEIVDQGLTQREFFKWLEILTITCQLYSEYIFYPNEITIQDGFLLPDFSTDKMFDLAMDKSRNPYLPFLEENVFPVLENCEYDLIWVNGQLRVNTVSIVSYIKAKYPNCIVAIRNHSSEYYSLNKIETLLKSNDRLFSLFDLIVLDDNQTTYNSIESTLSSGSINFSSIPNVIYVDKSTREIRSTRTEKKRSEFVDCISTRDSCNDTNFLINPEKIVNLRLNPNTQCFWKKCSFCGINEKYKFIEDMEIEDLQKKCKTIARLVERGAEYFWFEDEAISPESLLRFADELINQGIVIKWQARSRFHTGFSAELSKKLYLAGLREIRFGLESACDRILKSMNKFEADVNLDFVEEIVSRFVDAGVHVHFPMIVGYPTESIDERNQTYSFLDKLKEKYVYFSYNINILMLDVSSILYKNFAQYNISTVSYPCKPSEFLGNMISFDCSDVEYSYADIDRERIEKMSKDLYGWMPATALTESYIFYRLSETIRNTLVWSCNERKKDTFEQNGCLVKNQEVSIWNDNGIYYIYVWSTHNFLRCTNEDFRLLESVKLLLKSEVYSSELFREAYNLALLVDGGE